MATTNGHSQPTLNEVFRSIPETDRQRISDLIFNARTMRQEWLQKFADPRRDIDMECGYPVTTAMNAKLYKKLFDRNQTAARVVEVMPIECWQASVEVYEDEKSDVKTPFEVAFDQVADSLRGTSWYKDEKASPLWEALQRADILSGIGHFGVILLGLDDGKELSEPVDGINDRGEASVGEEEPLDIEDDGYLDEEDEEDTDPESNKSYLPKRKTEKDVKPTGNLFKPGGKKAGEEDEEGADPAVAEGAASSDDGDDADVVDEDRDVVDPENADLEEKPVETKRKLLYVRVFDESLVEIQVYESDKTNPRFGQPKMYSITLNDPDDAHSGLGLSMATIEVHWTRIIHIADNRNSSEVLGVPRQRPVLNRLLDLDKLYGGSAEMYWRGAFPGLSIETHPQLGGDVRMDADGVRSAIERYANSLQRFIAVEGVSVKTLSPQVVDPSTQIDTQITAICIKIACPKRIFMGSERGELASGQDSDTWDARVEGRRATYITPRIIVPLVDRLIAVGVLPVPKEYHVDWHSKKQLSPMDQAAVAQQRITALAAYIAGGCDVILSPMDLLTRELGYDDEEAEAILEATLKHMAEANPDAEEDLVPGKDPTPEPVEVMLDGDGKPHELKPGQKAVVAGGAPGGPPMPPGKGQPPGGPGKPPGGKPKFPPKKPTGNRRGPSRSFSWNEDGDNCGTGAGGFQEGNTCAKGGGSGSAEAKPVSARVGRIAKEVMAAAEKVEITSEVVGDPPPPPRSRRDAVDIASQTGHDYGPDHDFTDDIDTIEEMMTSRERERMEEHFSEMAYESASSYWDEMEHSDEDLGIEDQIENIEVDYASVARDNGYSSDDVETSAHDVISGHTEEGEVRDNLGGAVTAALMTARADGVDAFDAAIEALEEAEAPDAIISELKDRRSTAEEEIQTAADEVRDREAEQIRSDAMDNQRDSFIDSYTSDYDSSDDREYYLKDFYERHSTEPRFRPREEVDAERAAAATAAAAMPNDPISDQLAKPQSAGEAAKTSKLNKWGTERGDDSSMQYRFETPTNKYSIDMGISRGGGLPGLYHDPQAKIGNLTFGGEIGGFGKAETGNSNLVFGTVAPAVTALAMKRDLDVIMFSASHVDVSDEQKAAAIKAGRDPEKLGKSRQRLYDMLSQTIATANPKYAVLAKGRGDYRSYYVVKREILEKTKNSVRAAAGKSWDEYVKDSDIDILVNQAGYELVRNWINPRWFTKAFWEQNADIITNVFCANEDEGGDNCGTGAGGFQPGNTCAKGEGDGLSKRQRIAAAIVKEAEKIEVTDEVVPPMGYEDRNTDYDINSDDFEENVWRAMTPAERSNVESYIDAERDDWVRTELEDSSKVSMDLIARDAGYSQFDIQEDVKELVNLRTNGDDRERLLAAVEGVRPDQDGVEAYGSVIDALSRAGAPDSLIREVESARDDAATAIRTAAEESIKDEFDDSELRRNALVRFYRERSSEARFSAEGAEKVADSRRWGPGEKDNDSSMIFRFATEGDKYQIGTSISKDTEFMGKTIKGEFAYVAFSGEHGGYGVSGRGGGHEVFSTVTAALVKLVKDRNLTAINFSASSRGIGMDEQAKLIAAGRDPAEAARSRIHLYDRLTKTIATVMPQYEAVYKGEGDHREYYIAKKSAFTGLRRKIGTGKESDKEYKWLVKNEFGDVTRMGADLNPIWFTDWYWNGRKGIIANVFCATGDGGGVDPTCSPEGSTVAVRDDRGVAVEPVTPPPPGEGYQPRVTVDANGDGVTDHARVGVPAMVVPPPPSLNNYRLPNLTADERRVEDQAIALFESDPEKMVRDMIDMVRSAGDGKTFSTDDAKQLFLGVWNNAVPEIQMQLRHLYNTPLHQAANAIAKQALIEHLDTLKPGDNVLVTVGGCGAGKGYSLKNTDLKANAQAVWDSAGDQNATENPWILKLARERGLNVTYAYVHADPKVAWAHPEFGVVKRASNPKDGRMVDAAVFADSYAIGAKNHAAFARRHAGDKDVKFLYFQAGKPLEKMPREAFVNRNKLYKFALETIDGVEDATIKRGATVGERIWKGK